MDLRPGRRLASRRVPTESEWRSHPSRRPLGWRSGLRPPPGIDHQINRHEPFPQRIPRLPHNVPGQDGEARLPGMAVPVPGGAAFGLPGHLEGTAMRAVQVIAPAHRFKVPDAGFPVREPPENLEWARDVAPLWERIRAYPETAPSLQLILPTAEKSAYTRMHPTKYGIFGTEVACSLRSLPDGRPSFAGSSVPLRFVPPVPIPVPPDIPAPGLCAVFRNRPSRPRPPVWDPFRGGSRQVPAACLPHQRDLPSARAGRMRHGFARRHWSCRPLRGRIG